MKEDLFVKGDFSRVSGFDQERGFSCEGGFGRKIGCCISRYRSLYRAYNSNRDQPESTGPTLSGTLDLRAPHRFFVSSVEI